MKFSINTLTYLLGIVLTLGPFTNVYAKSYDFKFLKANINVTDSTEAADILIRNDSYTHRLSAFEIATRLNDSTRSTEEDYLLFASKQTLNWTNEEQEDLKKAFKEIETFIQSHNYDFELPLNIRIIKTNGREEFGAGGYTRGNNIVLNLNATKINTAIIAHELFHVFSRYNEMKRNMLYAAYGFRKCEYIDVTTPFKGKNITNPDCPVISHYITVKNKELAIVLYSSLTDTKAIGSASSLNVGLVELKNKGNRKIVNMSADNKPVIYDFSEMADIFKQVGTNTNYILHPEEIIAENFSALVTGEDVKEPIYLRKIEVILKK